MYYFMHETLHLLLLILDSMRESLSLAICYCYSLFRGNQCNMYMDGLDMHSEWAWLPKWLRCVAKTLGWTPSYYNSRKCLSRAPSTPYCDHRVFTIDGKLVWVVLDNQDRLQTGWKWFLKKSVTDQLWLSPYDLWWVVLSPSSDKIEPKRCSRVSSQMLKLENEFLVRRVPKWFFLRSQS